MGMGRRALDGYEKATKRDVKSDCCSAGGGRDKMKRKRKIKMKMKMKTGQGTDRPTYLH